MLKRILSLTLSCALLIPTAMLGSIVSNASGEEETDPFLIGAWFGNPVSSYLSDEQFQLMKDANINYFINNNSMDTANVAGNTAISELCAKYGMTFTAAISEVTHGTTHSDAVLEKLVNENKDLANCSSYYLTDEPTDSLIPAQATEYNKIKALDSSKFVYANLLPSYGLLPSMGTNVKMSGSYEEYVTSWVNAVGAENLEYLSYDHYPFRASSTSDTYFNDLEVIRKVAYQNGGIKTSCFLQSGTWNGMRLPSVGEQTWNMYTALAYGIKNINYFCWKGPAYLAPPAGEGMLDHVIDQDGNPTALYEPAKKINAEVTALGPTLMKVDAVHVYHTANVPTGATALPYNYFIKPSTGDDSIISLMKCKDGSGYYIMLVNKSMDTAKTLSFNISTGVGITGIKEVSKTTGKEVDCNYSGDVLTADFEAGEGRLFKLAGDVVIPDPVQAPEVQLKSGIYNGAQTVAMTTSVLGADIYYTLDGTYPTASKQKYTGPITIGSDTEDGEYFLRAVAVKDGDISEITECQYIINNGSKNVALNKPLTFQTTASGSGGRSVSVVNDGVYDVWSYLETEDNTHWAQVDFGKSYTINKANICCYHDWNPDKVLIQFSDDPTFTTGVTTVFNSDRDNTYGQGAGSDVGYADSETGHDFNFNPVTARYMRVWSSGNWGAGSKAIFEEIQAYTAPIGTPVNVALNKPVSFLKPMSYTGSSSANVVNDGVYNPGSYAGTSDGTNWAQIDFGASYTVDRANVCIYHDWNPNRVLIQFSDDPTFATGVTTVFNSDKENTYGQGAGTDELYADSETGHNFSFQPVTARYMRVWNSGNWGAGSAVFEEIQAYTVDETSGNVLDTSSLADWQVTGGGTWTASNGTIIQSDNDTSHSNWDRSLTYTKKTYKSFIAEATFKLDTTDAAAWGFMGIGVRKKNITDIQSTANSGFYISVEPKGRALIWVPGTGEVGSTTATIAGFDITSSFTMKVAVIGDLVSISINDVPITTYQSSAFAESDGYLSIHSGLLPIEVSNFTVKEVEPESITFEQAIDSVGMIDSFNVAYQTGKDDVIAKLPAKIDVTDTAGKTHSLDVSWDSDNYNKDAVGSYNFVGTIKNLPDGLLNVYDLSTTVNVKLVAGSPTVEQSSCSFTGSNDVKVKVTLNGGDFVSVSGNGITSDNYSFADGVLTINRAYLQTLSNGDYTFDVATSAGTVQISVNVSGNTNNSTDNSTGNSTGIASESSHTNPTTGEKGNNMVLVMLAMLSALLIVFKKKVKA